MDERVWKDILERYGQRVSLWRESGEREIKAFFQPVRERAAGEEPTPLGVAPRGKYLYLGPAEESLENVERLGWNGRSFHILRWREVPAGEGIAYLWGLLEEMDGSG
jgi:hypothetical protein